VISPTKPWDQGITKEVITSENVYIKARISVKNDVSPKNNLISINHNSNGI
jgi:hypothetical protein